MKKGKYLITGCAGFIGSNLVKKIYKKYDLILVDDLSEGSLINLPKNLRKKLIRNQIQNIKKLNIKKISFATSVILLDIFIRFSFVKGLKHSILLTKKSIFLSLITLIKSFSII